MSMIDRKMSHQRDLPLLSNPAQAPRQVDDYHPWCPEDGDAALIATRGFNALLLIGVERAALAQALRCDPPRQLHPRPDGLLLLVNRNGRPCRSAGVITLPGASLRFAGMDALRLS